MLIFRAKNENTQCKSCGTYFLRDEPVILYTFKKRLVNNKLNRVALTFHEKCYREWIVAVFDRTYLNWHKTKGQEHRVSLGRTKSYKREGQAKEVNKLNALIYYHKKQGHLDKMLELTLKLEQLKLGQIIQIPESCPTILPSQPGNTNPAKSIPDEQTPNSIGTPISTLKEEL